MQSFPLGSLWKLRRAGREAQQAQLAACLQKIAATQARQRQVAGQLEAARANQTEATRGGPVGIQQIRSHHEFTLALQQQLQQLQAEEHRWRATLPALQEAFLQADRDAKALENLRKRHAVGDAQRTARRVARELDEAGQRVRRDAA